MSLEVTARYTRVAIILHWLVAAFVIMNLVITWFWEHLPDRFSMPVANTHKTFGILVLGLALLRILWRLGHPPGAADEHQPRSRRRFVVGVHFLLYVLIVAMPLSGWLYDSAWKDAPANPIDFWGLFQMPRLPRVASWSVQRKESLGEVFGQIHVWLSYVLYGLFAAHVIGALKAQWLERTPVLQRMTLRAALRK